MNVGTTFLYRTIARHVVKIDPLVVSDRQKLAYTVVPGGNISAVRHLKCRPPLAAHDLQLVAQVSSKHDCSAFVDQRTWVASSNSSRKFTDS